MFAKVALLLIFAVLGGCKRSAGDVARDGGGDLTDVATGGSMDAQPASTSAPCQGTVDASGMTPMGRFSAASIGVYTNCSTIQVSLFDGCSGASLGLVIPYSVDSGVGQQSVRANLLPPNGGPLTSSSGTIDISELGDPRGLLSGTGQPSGQLTATFTLQQDGFSISGSFSSPYCGSWCQR